MSYITLTFWHLGSIGIAFIIGTALLFTPKGSPAHRLFGRVYLLMLMVSAGVTLLMPAHSTHRLFDHWGVLHILSFVVLYYAPAGWWAAYQGRMQTHRRIMTNLYIGSILIAGFFAFMPGRLLHGWLFG